MSVVNILDSISPPPPAVEEIYIEHYDLLLNISTRKFGVPHAEAEGLINEIFVTFLPAAHEIRNARSYLIGAICNASRYYWRCHGRTEALPEDFSTFTDPRTASFADEVATRITVRETVGRLHEKCRKTLHLKYWDGSSASEVAIALATTDRYAEKLIHKCLKRAQQIYRMLTENRGGDS